ncbi:TIGR03746 family integrating conjugative element protein [Ectothiorhodospira shaposhnikovii]|uniref:PFL_4703 family integrating conjugative element protein n=1 Tax=Ectothiorhodospira shaposhnikovii TaxID=1054 RepID=UPI001905F594|nr:TIGR03746 family integrating conjugative element protein [Ectothiorhodospira shaposhnikovii]MBK1674807.1 TIGR03746 family integrating conjugative element protein [Ectothiorhodospira shaposhnikovii]
MTYHREIQNVRAHIHTLRIALGVVALLALFMGWGWHNAPRQLTVHIPPDLRAGSTQPANEVPRANVYAFAHYIFQQLNRWPEDGSKDYGGNLFRLAAYLTPRFREELQRDLEQRGRRGELSGRMRGVRELPGAGFENRRVQVLRDGEAWVVWLDLEISESVRGMPVKEMTLRYPLRVVRYDVDPERNPWGLALDGFEGRGPERIRGDEGE